MTPTPGTHEPRPSAGVSAASLQNALLAGRAWSTHERIYFGSGRPPGKLGFLFPGQGSQYVGKVSDAALTANLRPGTQMNLRFTKSSFSSPAGNYFLQLYYDDGSGVGGALKRVSGTNPIAIRLQ